MYYIISADDSAAFFLVKYIIVLVSEKVSSVLGESAVF